MHVNVKFGEFLCLVNLLDMSPRAAFILFGKMTAFSMRQRWLNRLHSLRDRLKGRRSGVLSMALTRPGQLEAFHTTEYYEGQIFRWSEPDATIRLALPAADYAVEIEMLSLRAWPEGAVTIKFNRSPVVCDKVESGALGFTLRKEMFVAHTEQRLVLHCPRWEAATRDPRRLGFPIIGIHFEEIAATPAAQPKLPTRPSKVDR